MAAAAQISTNPPRTDYAFKRDVRSNDCMKITLQSVKTWKQDIDRFDLHLPFSRLHMKAFFKYQQIKPSRRASNPRANKCDLDADPAVTEQVEFNLRESGTSTVLFFDVVLQVLQDLVTEDQFIGWFLTSAKDDKNVAEAFNFLVDRAISDYEATRRFQQDNRCTEHSSRCRNCDTLRRPQGTISLSQNDRRGGNCSC
eukprot:747101-Hanusia_phi.AAC.2